ncbi:MAG TPA: DUF3787 domain-containing protein [Oscillospiraceae bacterium]|nr:DUF3787 domain-containing protein [Oscillospiraceae bacterium]
MSENRSKQKNVTVPIEKHQTAPWADMESLKQISRVYKPSEMEVWNAKDWVDSNHK